MVEQGAVRRGEHQVVVLVAAAGGEPSFGHRGVGGSSTPTSSTLHSSPVDSLPTVFIADSETNDIEPGCVRGMVAVRFSIEEPMPSTSAAGCLCESLYEVAVVLSRQPGDYVGVD